MTAIRLPRTGNAVSLQFWSNKMAELEIRRRVKYQEELDLDFPEQVAAMHVVRRRLRTLPPRTYSVISANIATVSRPISKPTVKSFSSPCVNKSSTLRAVGPMDRANP